MSGRRRQVLPGVRRRGPAGDPEALAVVGADITALSSRAAIMMVYRCVEVAVLAVLAVASGAASAGAALRPGLIYLAACGLLSLAVLGPSRTFAVRSFGLGLLVDGVYLQYQHEILGHDLPVDVALAANLVAVCLLASFRTGLKIALWQSLLLLLAVRGQESGLFGVPEAMRGVNREQALLADMALLWLVVVTTAVATAVNERELRRRRYDAEALAALATQLHGDEHPDDVATRLVRFAVDEVDARRALVCRLAPAGLAVVAAQGTAPVTGTGPASPASAGAGPGTEAGTEPGTEPRANPGWGPLSELIPAQAAASERDGATEAAPLPSAVLAVAARANAVTLALRLDPERDPWLSAALPDARRIVVVPLATDGGGSWLVVELGSRGGRRAERRMLSTVSQAVATAALALSRAELLQRAERAAATDALTGVANRRTFDATLDRCVAAWDLQGEPFALVLVDVDHFKLINDRFGHQVGDQALQVLARVLAGSARPDDVAARYGGEEFALILPGADEITAARVAERVRLALHDIERPVRLTASFGVAAVPTDATTAAGVVAGADAALIRAKNTGRDRVVLARHHADLPQGV